jgi:hypothetical protein
MPNVKIMFICPVTLMNIELKSDKIRLFHIAINTTWISLHVFPVIEMAIM